MQYTELDIMSDRIIGVKVRNNSYIVEIVSYVCICGSTTGRLIRPTSMLKLLTCYGI